MTTQPARRKGYGSLYKIYRRIRYIRYSRKIKKAELKRIRKNRRREEREIRRVARAQHKFESGQEKQKRSAEKKKQARDRKKLKKEVEKARKKAEPRYNRYLANARDKRKEERKFRKKRTRRLIRYLLKRKVRSFRLFILSLNIKTLRESLRSLKRSHEKRRQFLIISTHATLIFMSANMVVFLFSQIISSLAGTFFDYSSVVYFNNIYFQVRSDEWFADSVKVVFAAGPIAALLLSTLSLIIYSYIRYDRSLQKLIFLWGFLHGYTLFFGGLLVGTLFGRGFGHVIAWSFIMDTGRMVYSLIAISLMVLIGFLITKSFLISANSYFNTLGQKNRRLFIAAQVVAPYILGNLILLALRLPDVDMYYPIVFSTFFITLIPILASYRFYSTFYFEEEEIKIKPDLRLILGSIILIIFVRIIFSIGIPIG